jgi:hypothetical protein
MSLSRYLRQEEIGLIQGIINVTALYKGAYQTVAQRKAFRTRP